MGMTLQGEKRQQTAGPTLDRGTRGFLCALAAARIADRDTRPAKFGVQALAYKSALSFGAHDRVKAGLFDLAPHFPSVAVRAALRRLLLLVMPDP